MWNKIGFKTLLAKIRADLANRRGEHVPRALDIGRFPRALDMGEI